jgi:transcriptional regulator with XRE-family HTH domain
MTRDTFSLRAARKQLGLSQKELARKLGCSTRTIIRWERDPSRVTKGIRVALKALRKTKHDVT